MFGSTASETATGLIFIFLLVSVLVNELRLWVRFLRRDVEDMVLPIGWLALTASDDLNAGLSRQRGDASDRVIPGLDFSRTPRGDSLCSTLFIDL